MKKSLNKCDLHSKGFLLDFLFNTSEELIVFVNTEGTIIALSKAYAKFLGISQEEAIGKRVDQVIENTRMLEVIASGIPELERTHKIKGRNMIASRIPIIKDGEVIGAFGRVLFKDVKDLDQLHNRISKMKKELNFYESTFDKMNTARYGIENIWGKSPEMKDLRALLHKVSSSDSNITILGESGTGKELVAHAIHKEKWGNERPLVCVNCAAIAPGLLESELFGYEGGSFTGAKTGGSIGLFQAANGGTIFLDEIGEIPMHMQAKLLRVIQDRQVRRVGASRPESVDVRVIAATNRNLEEMAAKGEFRDDLYFRLGVIVINIPPLRERTDDIPYLAKLLLEKMNEKRNIFVKGITPGAMEYLKRYHWPGNVRELENVIEQAAHFVDDSKMIAVKDLPVGITRLHVEKSNKNLKQYLEEAERQFIVDTLLENNGRKGRTADSLGIGRTTLHEKMKKYEISAK
ncbi:sigma-54 interaction domain-containing protein [Emergencia sp.]|uniref:sigma-54 interaction domain-containing protein n=1 Tax=Emergencia sp. TaxID=1926557 RepID=UPI003AEF9F1F